MIGWLRRGSWSRDMVGFSVVWWALAFGTDNSFDYTQVPAWPWLVITALTWSVVVVLTWMVSIESSAFHGQRQVDQAFGRTR